MKAGIGNCEPARIDEFLADALSTADARALVSHLESCGACRRRMAETAAEPFWWNEASELLRECPFDADSDRLGPTEDGVEPSIERDSIDAVVAMLDPTDDPRMLGRLGGYEIVGAVGAGGMGVVLKAFDVSLNRYVALKALAPHLATSGSARRRFAREAQAAAAVVHDNVIAIHAVAETARLPYLVMPYLRGRSLQKRIDDDGPLSVAEVLRIGMQTAAGLAAAHAQGLVHRDVKPANIVLEDGTARVTITDFGLARAIDDATVTQSGVIVGTPQYMSPEQARGEPVDFASDLFSLGSVLYAATTGRPPFRADSTMGVLRRISDSSARPLCEVCPEAPAWLGRLVDRLHAKKPRDRFASADIVAEVCERCLAHVQSPTQYPLPAEVLHQPVATQPSTPDRGHPTKTWLKKGYRWAVAAGLIGTAAIGIDRFALRPSQLNEAPASTVNQRAGNVGSIPPSNVRTTEAGSADLPLLDDQAIERELQSLEESVRELESQNPGEAR